MTELPRLVNISNGQIIEINCDKFSVGRSLNCSYVLDSVFISRTHFIMEKNCERWILRDNSSNGTLLNGHIINYGKTKCLSDGDMIKLMNADTEFRFELFPHDNITDEQLCEAFESAVYEKNIDSQNNLLNDHCYNIHISIREPAINEEIISEASCSPSRDSIIPNAPEVSLSECNISNQRKRSSSSENNICKKNEETPNKKNKTDSLVTLKKSEVIEDNVHKVQDKDQGKINNFDMVEEEMQCSICSELFIKAVTLNCCHTFCSYCIHQWRKQQLCCPICRKKITSMAPTLVLDNFIEKLVGTMDEETKKQRKEIIESRLALVNGAKLSCPSTSKNLQHSDSTTSSAITSTSTTSYTTVTISSDEEDEDDQDFTDYSEEDDYYDHYVSYNGMPGKYYGGYGRCYNCNRIGHWANGCPYR